MQTINILMLLSAWIELVSGLGFGDWSLKFSKNKPKKLYNKFYDPKWAFYVMHEKRHHKPDMNSKSILIIIIHSTFSKPLRIFDYSKKNE